MSNSCPLIPITAEAYGVDIEIKYATSDNFTGKPVYAAAKCFLHEVAADYLKKAVTIAGQLGYRLRIYDAYRPTEAQWKLWNHTPDPDFLADPRRGSPHSRGVAVDLTLCTPDGVPLDMGTAFDAFTPLSHHGNTDIPVEAQRNRILLLGIMSAAGWDFYSKEWWHYQLFNARAVPLWGDKEAGTEMM